MFYKKSCISGGDGDVQMESITFWRQNYKICIIIRLYLEGGDGEGL